MAVIKLTKKQEAEARRIISRIKEPCLDTLWEIASIIEGDVKLGEKDGDKGDVRSTNNN